MLKRPSHRYLVALVAALVGAAGFVTPAQAATSTPIDAAAVGPVGPDCATVRAKATALAAAGIGTVGCMEARSTAKAGPSAAIDVCYSGSRQMRCDSNSGVYSVLLVPEMTPIGQIFYDVVTRVVVSGRHGVWTHSFAYNPTYFWGAVNEAILVADATCVFGCSPVGGTFAGGSAVSIGGLTGSATFETGYGGQGAVWYSQSSWSWYFVNPITTPNASNSLSSGMPAHRCDDALGVTTPVGCTFPQFRPVHEIGSLRYPTYARHIGLALNFGVPSVLTRTTNSAINAANRAVSCPSGPSYPRPAGFTCDEYPFASTYQGAAAQPYGRTFFIVNINTGYTFTCQVPWLPRRASTDSGGYSVCMVPAAENSGGGADLQSFYIDNRVIDGDTFGVRVV